jgi:UDP-N-acetylmuramyl pentapeptide phosphotransferase/UDP-N-acetylglucosamine-1-phosphate transferase
MPEINPLLDIAITAFSVSFVVNLLLSSNWLRHLAADLPGHRSLHQHPTPRTGGLGIITGIGITSALSLTLPIQWLAASSILITISLLDDFIGLRASTRLITQICSGGIAVYWLIPDGQANILLPILILVSIWATNLFNFMDGANGLAGGMALIGFGWLALFSWNNAPDIALLCLALAAASSGFLCLNFWSGRIFMGDSGSTLLGLMMALLGIAGWLRHVWPSWLPLMVFSPFIIDASLTLAKRIFAKQRFWEAHREHYYQRLIRSGWTHRKLALAEYGLMLLCGALAQIAKTQNNLFVIAICLALLAIYWIIIHLIDRRWTHFVANH